jgi:hypothetical protein
LDAVKAPEFHGITYRMIFQFQYDNEVVGENIWSRK